MPPLHVLYCFQIKQDVDVFLLRFEVSQNCLPSSLCPRAQQFFTAGCTPSFLDESRVPRERAYNAIKKVSAFQGKWLPLLMLHVPLLDLEHVSFDLHNGKPGTNAISSPRRVPCFLNLCFSVFSFFYFPSHSLGACRIVAVNTSVYRATSSFIIRLLYNY